MTQYIPLEIWKRKAVLHGILDGSANTKISEILGVNRTHIHIDEKQTSSLYYGFLVLSLAIVTLCFHSFLHMASDSTQRPTSRTWKRWCCTGLRARLLEDSTPGNRTLRRVTQAEELILGGEKISAIKPPLTYDRLTPTHITITLIITRRAQQSERPTKLCATSKMNWSRG